MPCLLPQNDSAPHKAIVIVRAEVHEILPDGQCSGRPSYKVQDFILGSIDGCNLEETVSRLEGFIKELKATCQNQS